MLSSSPVSPDRSVRGQLQLGQPDRTVGVDAEPRVVADLPDDATGVGEVAVVSAERRLPRLLDHGGPSFDRGRYHCIDLIG